MNKIKLILKINKNQLHLKTSQKLADLTQTFLVPEISNNSKLCNTKKSFLITNSQMQNFESIYSNFSKNM